MKKLDLLLEEYGDSHQNKLNKSIHWVCIPFIMFSLVGLLMLIPFPFEKIWFLNWAALILLLALIYYLRLSKVMFFGFFLISIGLLYGNNVLIRNCNSFSVPPFMVLLLIFIVAWIGQFYGHKIEGKKPSFFKDIQFLLIGPAWLLHFIFKKYGIQY